MEEHVCIDARFCGPPGNGHGGYVSGVVAAKIGGGDGGAEVTLRNPVPLDRELRVERTANGGVAIHDAGMLVAEAVPAGLELDIPAAPTLREAEDAARRFFATGAHPYPRCFACGNQREPGNGLRIFSGPMAESNIVAAPWEPDRSLCDAAGGVRREFLWAALDCPGGWAMIGDTGQTILLGRFTASIKDAPRLGERYVVIGWPIAADGRKLHAGTAIFSAAGALCAAARATWITV